MPEPVILQTNIPPGVIDLGMGNPDLGLLPLALLQNSADAYFSAGDPRPLQYGLEQGDGYFRLALAKFLTGAYGTTVDPGSLFVTSGASSALDLLCMLYTKPGDPILVEVPTYFLALRIFEDHGLNSIPIPMDADGLQIDVLERSLAEFRPKFLYTIPTFQNPSGRTLSQARREKLAALAGQYDFILVADEVYHCLPYACTPPPPVAIFSKTTPQVVSIGSFSKILAPGVRLGWIQAHDWVIKHLAGSGMLDSGGGLNPLMSALVRQLVESGGLAENIVSLRKEYAVRLNAMDTALRQFLPQAEYERPKGGFFFWVRLPGVDAGALRRRAQRFKVDIRPGNLFSSGDGMGDYFRLGFCFYDSAEIGEGVKRLADCLENEKAPDE